MDSNRIGSYDWVVRTGGSLSTRERLTLLRSIAVGQVEAVAGRVRLSLGRLPATATSFDLAGLQPPDSAFARAVEDACAEQAAAVVSHSYRTWLFGSALAHVDGRAPDPELFYCAALLHDFGVGTPTPNEDFTLRSANRAIELGRSQGLSDSDVDALADGICGHMTPGVSPDRDGELACYVQWGAMVDGAGLRSQDISPANREHVLAAHPRDRFKDDFAQLIRTEAKLVPRGRFALLAACGVLVAVRIAPFPS